jgi:hypothetical protein
VMRATDLLIWGIVVHLLVDWLGQNEWIAVNKAKRRGRFLDGRKLLEYNEVQGGSGRLEHTQINGPWWNRHPAAYIHAGMHGAAQLLVFPWWAALAIGVTHLLIDTRVPVVWWSKLIRQTQPSEEQAVSWEDPHPLAVMDIGADVRIWVDQVWHIGVIALLALVVA